MSGIPSSWVKVCFDDAIDVVSDRGHRIKQKEYLLTGQLPVVDQGEGLVAGYTNDLSAKVESNGSVIVFGDHTRRFKFVNFPFAVGADGVKLFSPAALWSSKFLFWQLGTINLEDRGYGRHYQHLRKEFLDLPPIAEQVRIVEKLEELLSDLETGVSELKAAQKKLAQYRQSLLKAAVEGALTAKWRANNKPTETGAQLLKRILQERRNRWEAKQLAKFKEQGKVPPKDWQKKYPEPVQPDTTDLPELPQGWVWANVDQLSEVIRGASPRPAGDPRFFGGNIPWITVGSITCDDEIYLERTEQFVTEAGKNASRFIEVGSLLLTNSGATLGVPKISKISGCINDGSVALLDVDEVTKLYLYWFLKTQTERLRAMNQGAAQPNLNTDIVRRIHVPLCSVAEQQEIIQIIQATAAASKQQGDAVIRSLKQSTAQRQNILKAAFSGQLVPQDPSDEPASELLARIRAERVKRASVKKPLGRKTKDAA